MSGAGAVPLSELAGHQWHSAGIVFARSAGSDRSEVANRSHIAIWGTGAGRPHYLFIAFTEPTLHRAFAAADNGSHRANRRFAIDELAPNDAPYPEGARAAFKADPWRRA
jgi:hypothetical protein